MFDTIKHRTVERLDTITKQRFIKDYKGTATPVILSQLTKDWPATTKWSFDYLEKVAGDNVVPVYSSKPAKDKEHQHAATMNIPLSEYLNMLKNGENDLRLFFYNVLDNIPSLIDDFKYPLSKHPLCIKYHFPLVHYTAWIFLILTLKNTLLLRI